MDIFTVVITKKALRDLAKVPEYVVMKLQAWEDDVAHRGLSEVRKIPGYHDEPLKGKRNGQRSIRLTKAYRAIYIIDKQGAIDIIEIIEVNKHAY
ncbi:MAG: type II toxin-antitoxin system mRNA interferase toxin, RelE/StbE family [Pseudomonadota bacterium]